MRFKGGSSALSAKRVDFVAQVAKPVRPSLTPAECRVSNIRGVALWMRRNTRSNEGQIGKPHSNAIALMVQAASLGQRAIEPSPQNERGEDWSLALEQLVHVTRSHTAPRGEA